MTEIVRITLATGNVHKRNELEACARESGGTIMLLTPEALPEVAESGKTFEENACLKASAIEPLPGSSLVLGEDSGLVVDILGGLYGLDPFPGVHTNRWLTPRRYQEVTGRPLEGELSQAHRNEALLALVQDQANRAGRYVCAMALRSTQSGKITTVTGTLEIRIANRPAGEAGFGYDPITIPLEGDNARTMAELDLPHKNRISHRGKAFRQLLAAMGI